uniref:Uncharacterized protein n=1 Tax=Amphimedon queenslandica TaxID=400682 RepID=A0A1X7SQH8_AMPQE
MVSKVLSGSADHFASTKCTFADVKPPATPTDDEDIKPAIIPPILPDADDKDIQPVIILPIYCQQGMIRI